MLLILSYSFCCTYFLIYPMCRSCSATSEFLSEKIAPCVAIHLVHPWEEGNSAASYVTILVYFLLSVMKVCLMRIPYSLFFFHPLVFPNPVCPLYLPFYFPTSSFCLQNFQILLEKSDFCLLFLGQTPCLVHY